LKSNLRRNVFVRGSKSNNPTKPLLLAKQKTTPKIKRRTTNSKGTHREVI
jgi:hypothetical protein